MNHCELEFSLGWGIAEPLPFAEPKAGLDAF